MREQKSIFHGILFYLCVSTIILFLTRLGNLIIIHLDLPYFLSTVVWVIVFISVLYYLFGANRKIPKIRWYVFLFFFLVMLFHEAGFAALATAISATYPANFGPTLAFNGLVGFAYLVALVIFAYRKYRPSKGNEENEPIKNYVWYGVILFIFFQFSTIFLELIVTYPLAALPLPNPVLIIVMSVLCLALLYLFIQLIDRRPTISAWTIVGVWIISFIGNLMPAIVGAITKGDFNTEIMLAVQPIAYSAKIAFYIIAAIGYYYTIKIKWSTKNIVYLLVVLIGSTLISFGVQAPKENPETKMEQDKELDDFNALSSASNLKVYDFKERIVQKRL